MAAQLRQNISVSIETSMLRNISKQTEKQMIIDALNKTDQNRTKAAELLGISRRTLQTKIKEYGL